MKEEAARAAVAMVMVAANMDQKPDQMTATSFGMQRLPSYRS
jgi:hypothetical protein